MKVLPAFVAFPTCSAIALSDKSEQYLGASVVEPVSHPPAKFGRRLASIRLGLPTALTWSPDGTNLLILSGAHTNLTLWRPAEERVMWTIPYAGSFNRPFIFTGDGRYIVAWPIAGGANNYLTVLDPDTGNLVYNIQTPPGTKNTNVVQSVTASADGRLIAFRSINLPAGAGWTLQIYSTDGWEKIAEYTGSEREGSARLTFTPDGNRIVSASMQYVTVNNDYSKSHRFLSIRVNNAINGELISELSEPTISTLNRLSVSPDGLNAAVSVTCATYTSGEDTSRLIGDTLLIYDLNPLSHVRSYPRLSKITWDVSWNQQLPLILAQDTQRLALWDSRSSLLYDLINNDDGLAAKFRPDGHAVAYIDSSDVVVREIKANFS